MFIFLNFIFFFLVLWASGTGETRPHKAEPGSNTKHNGVVIQLTDAKQNTEDTLGVAPSLFDYTSAVQYDSVQNQLPNGKKDSRILRKFNEKYIALLNGPDDWTEKIGEIFLHNAAKLTFLFLFVCSFLLWLFYHNSNIPFLHHAFFSIHLVCTFLLLSIFMVLLSFVPYGGYVSLALFLYGSYYFYRAMRVIYKQAAFKTFAKFTLINLFLGIAMIVGLVANLLIAFIIM